MSEDPRKKYPRDRYPVAWNRRTNRGRVVYDRKSHPFTCNDARRIIGKITEGDEGLSTERFNCYQAIIRRLHIRIVPGISRVSLDIYIGFLVTLLGEARRFRFGGGKFGGGGAQREF